MLKTYLTAFLLLVKINNPAPIASKILATIAIVLLSAVPVVGNASPGSEGSSGSAGTPGEPGYDGSSGSTGTNVFVTVTRPDSSTV